MTNNKRPLKCRKCPTCSGIMLQAMCIRSCEYVCFPCEEGVELMCGLEEIYLSHEEHDELRKLYYEQYTRLAFTVGGATCNKCSSNKGNNCEYCKFEQKKEVEDES